MIHRLTYRRTNHDNIHVRGYKEEGTITTPFDMTVLNDLDRFHLVMDVVDRLPQTRDKGSALREGKAFEGHVAQRSEVTDRGRGRRRVSTAIESVEDAQPKVSVRIGPKALKTLVEASASATFPSFKAKLCSARMAPTRSLVVAAFELRRLIARAPSSIRVPRHTLAIATARTAVIFAV